MALRSDAVSSLAYRSVLGGVVFVLAIAVGGPAAAQEDAPSEPLPDDVADEVIDAFDENESEATIEWVTRSLVGIAGGTGFLLVVYLWHTNPSHRLRVATRRRERREATTRLGLEDEFVLPAEVDEEIAIDDEGPAEPAAKED